LHPCPQNLAINGQIFIKCARIFAVNEPVAAGVSSAPDWSQVERDILCPLCEYNLRGLAEPRCPECGFRFDWHEIFTRDQYQHPFLFEHHPECNVWSFFATLLASARPFKFWSTIRPTLGLRPGRLCLYWLTVTFLSLAPWIAGYLFLVMWHQQLWASRVSPRSSYYVLVSAMRIDHWFVMGGLVLWPALALGVLMIFQQSMRRASIKPSHMMRCCIYSGDVVLWLILVTALACASDMTVFRFTVELRHLAFFFLPVAAILLLTIRLAIALRRYLCFPHAAGVAIATQVIIVLLVITALLNSVLLFR
jgi:hypothetical protein